MRVGFDVSPLCCPHPRGVVRATEGLVGELERRGVLEVVRLAPEPGCSLRLWRQHTLPGRAAHEDLAGIHSPVSAFPLRGPGQRVQTVHELPWMHGAREGSDARHRIWASLGPARADAVLCPTEHVARQLRDYAILGAAWIHSCPWGVAPAFRGAPPSEDARRALLDRIGAGPDPIALCLGAVRPKKNLAALLRGMGERLARGGDRIQVVVAGESSPQLARDLELARELGVASWIRAPGAIDEADLPALLRASAVVPVLSTTEGFGLPVLEALACGAPVVVPRDSAPAEVAGEAGIAVDPADPATVADGLELALNADDALRGKMRARAEHLSWTRCAEQVEELWRELAAR